MDGGGHERGNRSGTLNVPGIVGFAKAAQLMVSDGPKDTKRVHALAQRMHKNIDARLDTVILNGHPTKRLNGNLNLSFSFVEGEGLMMAIKDIAVSSGSACTSSSLEPSYVLRAMGLDEEMAHSSIRFGLGRFNTEEEVDFVADLMVEKVQKLRDMSPLYEMHLQGIDIKSIEWTGH
jgi:cysteine desulfurase